MKHYPIRIMGARYPPFCSPLIVTIAAGFLREEGFEATCAVLPAEQRPHDRLTNGEVDATLSAVGSNWGSMEVGERDALAAAIEGHQESGCRDGDIAISRELCEQALGVFLHCRAITRRHPYEEIVVPPCVK